MKKIFILLSSFLLILTGCHSDNSVKNNTTVEPSETIYRQGLETKEAQSQQTIDMSSSEQASPDEPESNLDFWDISSSDLKGNEVKLKDHISSNSLTLINFWGTYCGPCKIELPDLQKISKDYASDNVSVIAIALDVTEEQKPMIDIANQIFEELGVEFPSLMNNEEISKKLASGIFAVPTTVLLDSQGNVIENPIIGAQSYDFFSNLIESALPNE